MEYIYIGRDDDEKTIADYKRYFKTKTMEELVDAYNKQVRCGIVGVHRQALYLLALRQEFKDRLTESPVYLLEYVLGLVGEIEIFDGHIKIMK